jgi:hypothetical protein
MSKALRPSNGFIIACPKSTAALHAKGVGVGVTIIQDVLTIAIYFAVMTVVFNV